jgi:hypothetical protein
MMGKNLLWCARQHGHSVQVMTTTYAVWIEGSTEADLVAIRTAFEAEPTASQLERDVPSDALEAPKIATKLPLEPGWGRLSWRKGKHFNSLTGGADGSIEGPVSY